MRQGRPDSELEILLLASILILVQLQANFLNGKSRWRLLQNGPHQHNQVCAIVFKQNSYIYRKYNYFIVLKL